MKKNKRDEYFQELNNPAKSAHIKKKRKKKYVKARRFGKFLVFLQTLLTLVFLGLVYILNIFPIKYMIALAVALFGLWLVVKTSQKRAKKRGILGKMLSIVVIGILGIGIYYVGVINGAFNRLIGGTHKIDTMAVVVLKEDKANTLEDAKYYNFGVQYLVGGDDTRSAINAINDELDTEIRHETYADMYEQIDALYNKEVNAIIYNEGYRDMVVEEVEGFGEKTKVIYTHEIKKELEETENINVDVLNSTFNVYLSGIDVYGDITKTSRSDVNIIATVNPATHQILLTTTPRDMYMTFPNVTNGQKDKLTHAGIYGVDTSIAALENFYETEIPFYVKVNFTSIIEIVDRLGGIEVYSEYGFTTIDGLKVKKGMNSFNGEQALSFARERKNVPDGDNQRGKNQQAVIVAMIRKMLSPQMLINATGIINSVSDNMETNMTELQIQEFIKKQLNEGGAWNIYSAAAEGTAAYAYTYSMPNREVYVTEPSYDSVEKIQNLMKRVENGEILENSEVAE